MNNLVAAPIRGVCGLVREEGKINGDRKYSAARKAWFVVALALLAWAAILGVAWMFFGA